MFCNNGQVTLDAYDHALTLRCADLFLSGNYGRTVEDPFGPLHGLKDNNLGFLIEFAGESRNHAYREHNVNAARVYEVAIFKERDRRIKLCPSCNLYGGHYLASDDPKAPALLLSHFNPHVLEHLAEGEARPCILCASPEHGLHNELTGRTTCPIAQGQPPCRFCKEAYGDLAHIKSCHRRTPLLRLCANVAYRIFDLLLSCMGLEPVPRAPVKLVNRGRRRRPLQVNRVLGPFEQTQIIFRP